MIMSTEKKELKVGDILYRVVKNRWTRTKKSVERIERLTQTLAISHNGVRYKRDLSYNINFGCYFAEEKGSYTQSDRFVYITEVDSYVQQVADWEELCMKVDWVCNQKFTTEQRVAIYDLFNKK